MRSIKHEYFFYVNMIDFGLISLTNIDMLTLKKVTSIL